ncbi:MAG: hypothetical protein ACOX8B_09520 [Lachnospiraceae bacterium]|jgi:hypothetical protein
MDETSIRSNAAKISRLLTESKIQPDNTGEEDTEDGENTVDYID